jgi:AcrR family transcriptional regulator
MVKKQQQRAIETRQTVVEAAARVFARQGYRATTLRDITNEAGVTQGALYFHFDSKQQLAAEIIRRQHARSIVAGAKLLEDAGASGIASMVSLSGVLAAQIVSDPIVQAGLRLSTESADDLSEDSKSPYVEWISSCRLFLEKARQQGETREGLNLDAAAEVVISAFTGTQFVSAALSQGSDLIERLERLWPTLLLAVVRDDRNPVIVEAPRLVRTAFE